MKQGRTLQEVATELARQRESKRDFVVSAGAMRLSEDASRFSLLRADGTDRNESFGMTGLFLLGALACGLYLRRSNPS